jgi:hypothetical protein
VPCIAGSFFFDRLPVGYTEVSMSVYGTSGGFLDSSRASAVGSNGVVTLSLLPP